ncbi:MAG: YraN family protein [Ancrocorticia sp.]
MNASHILLAPDRPLVVDLGEEWAAPPLPENATNRELGAWGEELAARNFRARGIDVLDRNWRCRQGEIDLVCWDPQRRTLFACEVKTRREGGFVPSLESVSRSKLARLRLLLSQWLASHDYCGAAVSIDVVAITVREGEGWDLCHVEAVA